MTIVVMDDNAVPYVAHDGVEPTACLINITLNACYMFNWSYLLLLIATLIP